MGRWSAAACAGLVSLSIAGTAEGAARCYTCMWCDSASVRLCSEGCDPALMLTL